MQQTTVAPTASIIASRSWLDMPPPGTQCSADLAAGVEAGPEPEKRPERKRKEDAIAGPDVRRRGRPPSSSRATHCQLSFVSIQRSGRPVVDEVWQ